MNRRLRKLLREKQDEETIQALLADEKISKGDIELAEALNAEAKTPNAGQEIKITRREEDVLEPVRREMKQAAIAAELKISLSTVRAHLQSAKKKLRTRTAAGAAAAWTIRMMGPGQKD